MAGEDREDRPQFVGFNLGAMAAQFLGVPLDSDPMALAMQYAASASTESQPPARRLAIARTMQAFFGEMEAKAAAELSGAAPHVDASSEAR